MEQESFFSFILAISFKELKCTLAFDTIDNIHDFRL